MIIYITVFFITTLCVHISEKRTNDMFFCITAVLLLSLCAGLRNLSVGADTGGYPLDAFNLAVNSNSYLQCIDLLSYYVSIKEVGYSTLAYIVSRFTTDISYFFFVTNAIVNMGVIIFLRRACTQHSFPVWLGWLSYCFLFYNHTLSISKQSIAIGIVLCALTLLYDRKFKWYVSLILLAATFHFSALLSMICLFEFKIVNKHLRRMLILFIGIIVLGRISILQSIISQLNIFERFIRYTNNSDVGDLAIFETIYKAFILLGSLLFCRLNYIQVERHYIERYLYIGLVEILLFSYSLHSAFLGRISFYFLPFYFVFVPLFLSRFSCKNTLYLFYTVSLLVFWIFTITIQGSTLTYPYKFA